MIPSICCSLSLMISRATSCEHLALHLIKKPMSFVKADGYGVRDNVWDGMKDGDEVLTHLSHNLSDFYQQEKRAMVSALSEFLANTLIELRPEEASAARVLAELVRNQQM